MLHRPIAATPPIHPAYCACFDCSRRDPVSFAEKRREVRAWAILFIGIGGALYGAVIASLPEIAAAFGWRIF
jgi:hypothetical protein